MFEDRYIIKVEGRGYGDWLVVWGEGEEGIVIRGSFLVLVIRWKKKILIKIVDVRESSRCGVKIDMGLDKNRF